MDTVKSWTGIGGNPTTTGNEQSQIAELEIYKRMVRLLIIDKICSDCFDYGECEHGRKNDYDSCEIVKKQYDAVYNSWYQEAKNAD